MKRLLQTTGLIFAMLLWANVGMAQDYTFSPAHEATGVSTSPTLTIEFDEEVKPGGGAIILKKDGENVFSFFNGIPAYGIPPVPELDFSEKTLTIDLSGKKLEEGSTYYVTTTPGAILVDGNIWNNLEESNNSSIWSFTTGASPVDPGAPIIVSLTPPKDTTDVSVTPTLILEFDRDITKGSSGYFKIKLGSSDAGIYSTSSGQVSISGNKLTINASGLRYNTTYHVEINPGFIQNYSGLSDPTYWTFTTESKPPQWADNYPTITQSPTGFTFKGKTDLGGTYYFVVTGNNEPPTITQIKAGQNHLGAKAYESGNETMIGNNEFIKGKDFSKMNSRIPYYLHAVVTSDNEKNSEVKTRIIDRIRPIIEDELSNLINGYNLFNVNDSIKIVFSKKVFNYNGEITELTSASFTLKNGEEIVPFDFSVSSDGTEVTLTPTPPLSGNTEYTVVISPLSDEFFNVMSSSVTRTFYTDQLNVWTGISSEFWEDNGNWTEPYVARKSVLIQSRAAHFPTINSDITVNNLTIEAGAVLTQTGGVISVLGDFDLLSSEEVNASYLPKGGTLNVGGETRVHQYIDSENGLVSYSMASPTDNTDNGNIGTHYKIQYYENPTDSWLVLNTEMQPGIGYSVYSLNDLVFSGNINRTSVEVRLVRTDGKGYGWNLLGNPYTASVLWGDLDVDTAKIENSYWIWTPTNKVYGAFNQESGIGLGMDGEIPSNHGFLVKLKNGQTSGLFTFDTSAMHANTKNYLKSAVKSKPPHIKISAGNSDFVDQVAVAFVPDASPGVDKYDTEKFFGNGNPFQIFTVEGSTKLSINSLPETNDESTVLIGYKAAKIGAYTIHLNEDWLEHSEIILTDSKTNTAVDLMYDRSYTFNVDKQETNISRFKLTFPAKISTLIKEVGATIYDMKIYLKDGDVVVDVIHEIESLTYELVGVSGNIVGKGVLYPGINNLGRYPVGLYIINSRNGAGTIVSKKLLVYR